MGNRFPSSKAVKGFQGQSQLGVLLACLERGQLPNPLTMLPATSGKGLGSGVAGLGHACAAAGCQVA